MKTRDNRKYLAIFCMVGFLLGILYTNIVSKDYAVTLGIFDEYFLNQYMHTEVVVQEYLWYILRVRALPMIAIGVLGCMRIRKAAVICFLIWTGCLSGILFTSGVLKMGIKGILLCLIAGTPHFLFYIAGYSILLWYLYTYPSSKWNMSKSIFLLLMMGVGIIAECYINPILVKMFLKTI